MLALFRSLEVVELDVQVVGHTLGTRSSFFSGEGLGTQTPGGTWRRESRVDPHLESGQGAAEDSETWGVWAELCSGRFVKQTLLRGFGGPWKGEAHRVRDIPGGRCCGHPPWKVRESLHRLGSNSQAAGRWGLGRSRGRTWGELLQRCRRKRGNRGSGTQESTLEGRTVEPGLWQKEGPEEAAGPGGRRNDQAQTPGVCPGRKRSGGGQGEDREDRALRDPRLKDPQEAQLSEAGATEVSRL